MKKLLFLLLIATTASCTKLDVDEDIVIEKAYFLNGMINETPYEIVAGENNILMDYQREFDDDNSFLRVTFGSSYVCINDCEGFFEFNYFWPVSEFGTTREEQFPLSIYSFADQSSSLVGKFKISFQNLSDEDIYFSDTFENNSNFQLEFLDDNVEENKVQIKFDCDLKNASGEVLELRDFEGFVRL